MDAYNVDFTDTYFDLLDIAGTAIPPLTRELTRRELFSLTKEEIQQLKNYVVETFPQELSKNNFACLSEINQPIQALLSSFEMGDIILAPGDSPYKLVKIIENVYDLVDVRFITFPISGLAMYGGLDTSLDDKIDQYLVSVLNQHGITSPINLKIMDYKSSGKSIRTVQRSLRRIFDDAGLKVPIIDTHILHDTFCLAIIDDLFSRSEATNSRCMARYNLLAEEQSVGDISKGRCATIIALISLYLMGRLN